MITETSRRMRLKPLETNKWW